MGPDFAHPIHMPRTQFREGEWDDVIEEKTPYLAHVYDPQLPRVYDILTAAFTTWNDLSMFLAYPFSGFHGLTVKWWVSSINITLIHCEDDAQTGTLELDIPLKWKQRLSTSFLTSQSRYN